MNPEQLKTSEIKNYVSSLSHDRWEEVSKLLCQDSRAAVQKMGESLQSKLRKMEQETHRLKEMAENDRIYSLGARVYCGVDEAGRGPLAGPVVAASVILPEGYLPEGLNDSKKVPEARRELLYDDIVANALAWGVGIVEPARIDEINILEATREAMLTAVMSMHTHPEFVLLDAVEIKALSIPHKGIIKGDEKCLSIAAASIIAKVTRDRIMTELGGRFAGYGFEIHKGYGTAMHYEALNRLGMSVHHRRSFLKNWQG